MSVDFTYHVRVGVHVWEGAAGDPWEYGPLDGLTITNSLTDSPLWPSPEAPPECRFQLIAPNATELADVALGTPVAVKVTFAPGKMAAFAGRVADLTSVAHPLGLIYTLNCLDYSADLREETVGGVAYPQENILERVNRILTEAGQPVPAQPPRSPDQQWPIEVAIIAAREPEAANAYDLIDHTLSQWAVEFYQEFTETQGYGRAQLVAQTSTQTGEWLGWRYQMAYELVGYSGVLALENVAGVWELQAVAGPTVFPADAVDYGATWAITKATQPTRVTLVAEQLLTGSAVLIADQGVVPPINAELSCELTSSYYAEKVPAMYLPDPRLGSSAWTADAFTLYLEQLEPGKLLPGLGSLVTVSGLPEDQTPSGRSWYTAMLSSWTLTVANESPVYTFQLSRPGTGPTYTSDLLQWNSPALQAAPKARWSTMDPTMTWRDLYLASPIT